LPFVLFVLVFAHIGFLHEKGSTDILSNFHLNKLKFDLFFLVKDLFSLFRIFLILLVIFFNPFFRLDRENFIKANVLLSPVHIQPE
jgi:quinol-cytochrome oxidoreductase complex cytochrome b subunit